MSLNSFYSEEELKKIGFKNIGKNVKISRNACIYNPESISIGDNVRIDDFCILTGHIEIGSYIHIAAYCGLFGKYGIVLQDFSGLSSRVVIYSATDDYSGICMTNPTVPEKYKSIVGGKVQVGRHCIIGTGTVILPDVKIKDGAAVGAMSLVNQDLEKWKIYAGIPCRFMKDRKKDILKIEQEFYKELKL